MRGILKTGVYYHKIRLAYWTRLLQLLMSYHNRYKTMTSWTLTFDFLTLLRYVDEFITKFRHILHSALSFLEISLQSLKCIIRMTTSIISYSSYEFLIYLKAERISAVSNNKLKLFDIKWKDWKKYISINIKWLFRPPKAVIHNVSIIL